MRKVSKTMLAVIAAIQSGAHTRRKPKYIREQALVSGLYPLPYSDSAYFGAKVSSVANQTKTEPDQSVFGLELMGEVANRVKNITAHDNYSVSADFLISFTNITTREIGIAADDNYFTSGDFIFEFSRYSINYINLTPEIETQLLTANFSLAISKS